MRDIIITIEAPPDVSVRVVRKEATPRLRVSPRGKVGKPVAAFRTAFASSSLDGGATASAGAVRDAFECLYQTSGKPSRRLGDGLSRSSKTGSRSRARAGLRSSGRSSRPRSPALRPRSAPAMRRRPAPRSPQLGARGRPARDEEANPLIQLGNIRVLPDPRWLPRCRRSAKFHRISPSASPVSLSKSWRAT